MFAGEQLGEAIVFLLHEFQELEHHAGAALRVGRCPGRLRSFRVGDSVLDFGMLGERNLGLHFAGIGIEHVAKPPGSPFDGLAADEMADLTHGSNSSGFLKGLPRDLTASMCVCSDFYSLSHAGHGGWARPAGRFPIIEG
jgi:hypothetical protein